jgi:hypothetical protein
MDKTDANRADDSQAVEELSDSQRPHFATFRCEHHGQQNTARNAMRGMGRTYQPDWRDKNTGEKRFSPIWWIAYSVRGKLIRESSHSRKESDGRKLLKKRLGEIAARKPVGPDIERTNFEDLAAMIVNDYKCHRTSKGVFLRLPCC